MKTIHINQRQPEECTCIEHVRQEIDAIDSTIINLLAQRFAYVREVVKYKGSDHASIEANDRRQQVIQCRSQWAEELGLSPEVIGDIWDRLIAYFIEEEKKIAQNK